MPRDVLIRLFVNGEEHAIAAPPERTLLEALRYDLALTGSKQGCDKGDCGACTVLSRSRDQGTAASGASPAASAAEGGRLVARPRSSDEGTAGSLGSPILACITLAQDAQDLAITTIEGLAGPGGLDPIQQAFADCGALQCGFCQPGMMLSARALLNRCAKPSLPQIREALSGNLCRCTGYTKIYEAVEVAAGLREPSSRAPVASERAAASDQIAHLVKEHAS